jgi:signal transduction histidine kinase
MRRSSRGLGVGLAVAKQVLEQHGGRIEARSAGIGFGSRFTVRVPLAKL